MSTQQPNEDNQNSQLYKDIIELVPVAVLIFHQETHNIVYANPEATQLLCGKKDCQLKGKSVLPYVHPDFLHLFHERAAAKEEELLPFVESKIIQANNTVKDVIATNRFIKFKSSPCVLVVASDITEKKAYDQTLMESEQRYRSLFENNANAVYSIDLEGSFFNVNNVTEQITGYSKEQLLQMSFRDLAHPDDIKKMESNLIFVLEGKSINYDARIIHKHGHIIDINITVVPMRVYDQIVGIFGIAKDISDQVNRQKEISKSEERYQHLAMHDPLTGLPNRRKFSKQANIVLNNLAKDETLSLFFIDLDHFKLINDSMGHNTGDLVLKMVATRLQSCINENDLLCRIGGDEFILCLPKRTKHEVIEMASLILKTLEKPFVVHGNEVYTTPSIGISIKQQDDKALEELIMQADMAMYRAKEAGKNTYKFFSTEMEKVNQKKLILQNGLRSSNLYDQLFLTYQPKINLSTNKISGAEALIRWNHPTLGLVSPAEFIPIAEDIGIIHTIGEWVLKEACTQLKHWHDQGFPNIIVSVNISVQQFLVRDLISTIKNVLAESGLPPQYLTLEITESMAMLNIEQSVEIMKNLRKLGVGLSIDDFGTGYSSLNYLKKFPVTKLKLDRSFIKELSSDNDKAIIEAIVLVARKLGLQVIFEGIETSEQLEFAKRVKGDIGQGFLFSKPLRKEEFVSFLSQHSSQG